MESIPNPIRVNTGEQGEVTETIDNFFNETIVYLEEHYRTERVHFEIRSGELAYIPSQVTNDRITYLKYKDMILATVFETRTEFNHIKYTFFRNEEEFKELKRR